MSLRVHDGAHCRHKRCEHGYCNQTCGWPSCIQQRADRIRAQRRWPNLMARDRDDQ